MATSGTFGGNNLGNNRYFWGAWQLAQQDVANNRSLINWQSYAHFENSDNQLDNGYTNSSVGMLWQNTGRVKNFTGVVSGHRDVGLASGSFWIGHNADGTQSVWFSGAVSYYGTGRSENGGQSWALPTIARASQPSVNSYPNNSPNTNIGDSPYIHMNSASGGFRHTVIVDFGSFNKTIGTDVINNVQWNTAADAAALYAQIPNAMQGGGTITVHTYSGGTYIGTKTCPITLIIPAGTANPTFPDFTYKDTTAATVAITGSDQVIVQGKSTVRATVSAANKMTPVKSATAINYTASLDGVVDTKPFSSSAAVDMELGAVASNGAKTLAVKANDSRGNSTTVSKDLAVVPYLSPVLNVTATRLNNFEAATTIKISGTFSRVTVGGTDKNSIKVTPASSLRYRLQQDGGSWSSWVTLSVTQATGAFSTADVILSLVNSSEFNVQVEVQDQFETVTSTVLVNRGVPIVMVSDNKEAVGFNKMPDGTRKGIYVNPTDNIFHQIYPVGVTVELVVDTNPAVFWGGTWALFGVGRTTVGVNTSDGDFNTVKKTGGSKELQAHSHNVIAGFYTYTGSGGENSQPGGSSVNYSDRSNVGGRYGVTTTAGGGNAGNLMPYITVYRWERTA